MDNFITIIYPYYDNPAMFKQHQKEWMSWPKDILDKVEFMIGDDCSPNHPAIDNVIVPKNFHMRMYRNKVDIMWNDRSLKNVMIYGARGDSWIFFSDMDLVLPLESIKKLLNKIKNNELRYDHYYTFNRVTAPDMTPWKNHPNTYFFHRDLYLQIGGHDEQEKGIYGLDGVFRRRLNLWTKGEIHFDDINIIRYTKEIMPDCRSNLPRKENRDENEVKRKRKIMIDKIINKQMPLIFSIPYTRAR